MRFLFSYYTLAIVLLTFIWGCYKKLAVPDLHIALLLTGVIVLYGVLFRWIHKNRLQVFLGMIAVVTGFYGFTRLTFEPYSILNALYSTFRLFLLDVDPVFNNDGAKFATYPLAIEIARFSAAACTISTVFSLIYTYFGQSVKILWHRLFGGHVVIIGYNDSSKILIENLCSENKQIMLLAEDVPETQLHYLQRLGVIVLVGKQGEQVCYKKASLHTAELLIIFYEDDSKNLNEILAINRYVQEDWSKLALKQMIVHLTYPQSTELFDIICDDLHIHERTTLKVLNMYKLSAIKILNEHPLYKGYESRVRDPQGAPLHLLFIGFGHTGRYMAIQAIENYHFFTKAPLTITVLDKAADKVQKTWYDSYPKSDQFVNIRFERVDIEIDSLESYLQNYNGFTHIFICLEDDFQDLQQGMDLTKKIPHIPIYLKIRSEGQISEWLHHNKSSFRNLYLFGDARSILDYEYVVNNKQEAFAKRAHQSHQAMKAANGSNAKDWNDISTFEKESNRSQFHHLFVKLMLLGLKAVKREQANSSDILTKPQYEQLARQHLEALAASEHHRWNTFHFIRGWDTLHTIHDKVSDRPNKLHGCLVDYDELDRVGQLMNEPYKQYNRDVVLGIYDSLERLGYVIVKDSIQ